MASPINTNRLRTMQFTLNGRRKTLRLGRLSASQFGLVRSCVNELVNRKNFGVPIGTPAARWLGTINGKLHAKLESFGIVESRGSTKPESPLALKSVWDSYIARHTHVKQRTRDKLEQIGRSLIGLLGPEKNSRLITKSDAKDWRASLVASRLSPATVSGYVIRARQVFADAVDRHGLPINPFQFIKAGSQDNDSRERFIDRRMMSSVFGACPDLEWVTIFALARFGGMRTPSEVQALKWEHIDWAKLEIRVTSSKTEHHGGKGSRVTPLFKELAPFLRDAFDAASEGSEYVITKYRSENLRTQAHRIIKRAGLTPWPRTFQNLRSSRQTELVREYPLHVVCRWLGNSPRIARKHYLQVTPDDWEKATGQRAAESAAVPRKNNRDGQIEIPDFEVNFSHSDFPIAATGLEPVTRGL
jgi:integrase